MKKAIILNAVQASAADLTTPGAGLVVVTGLPEGFYREDVKQFDVQRFLTTILEDIRVTASAAPAVGTTYSFYIEQRIQPAGSPEFLARKLVQYTAVAGETATSFGIALAANVQALIDDNQLDLTVAAHATGNGGCDISGTATNATFKLIQLSSSVGQATLLALTTSSGNASYSGTLVTILQDPTGLVAVGDTVRLLGWTGVALLNGFDATEGTEGRVESLNGTTDFKVRVTTATGSMTAATIKFQPVAQDGTGTGASIIAKGITEGGSPSVSVTSGNVYDAVILKGGADAGRSVMQEDPAPFEITFYINSGDTDTPDLLTRFDEVKNYYNAGAVTFDPALKK